MLLLDYQEETVNLSFIVYLYEGKGLVYKINA